MKLLVITMAGIGDTLLCTPLIHELRLNFPDAQIDAVTKEGGSRDLLEGTPHLNTGQQKNCLKTTKLEAMNFLLSLRRQKYDGTSNTHRQSRIAYRIIAPIVG